MKTVQPMVITVEGGPYERGFQYGSQCAEIIQFAAREAFPKLLKADSPERLELLKDEAERYQPFIAEHANHLIDEMRGIVDGAGITWREVLLLQTRPELANASHSRLNLLDHECSTIGLGGARTKDGQPIVAQNVDMNEELKDLGVILRIYPDEGPSILTWTLAGVLGQTGINSAGLGRCGNVLFSGGWRIGVPTSVLFRLALEQESVDGVIDLCERIPRAKSNNFMVCDQSGKVADIEMTVEDQEVIYPNDDSVLHHTNHYCHPNLVPEDTEPHRRGTQARQARLETLTNETQGGTIDVDEIISYLSDHENEPQSICRHGGDGGVTVASCVLIPGRSEAFISLGNPCEVPYERYQL